MEDNETTREQLIAEREVLRAKVRKLESRLKEVRKLSGIAQWEVDLSTGEISWSDEDFRILGYRPGEVEPSWALMLQHIHPEDLPLIEAQREKMHSGEPVEAEYRIIQKGGRERYVYSKNEFEYDAAGEPCLLRGIFRDITDRK